MAVSRKMRREMDRSQGKKAAAPVRKKPQPGAPVKKRTSPGQFLKEVRAELKKIAWPSRTELIQSTVMVLVILTSITAVIYFLDIIFAQASSLLTK